jgi:SAM-dependent methyltransferase
LFSAFVDRYVTIDIRCPLGASVDLLGDALRLPVQTGVVDTVLSSNVLQYVTEPTSALDEAWRVLRPGGQIILAVPNVWRTDVDSTDRCSPDRHRFTAMGVRALLEASGFSVKEVVVRGALWSVLFENLYLHIADVVARGPIRRIALVLLFPIEALGWILDRVDSDTRLCLGFTAVGQKTKSSGG